MTNHLWGMRMHSVLLSNNALAVAWTKALVSSENGREEGELALAMALAYPKENWDTALVSPKKVERPPLHWALSKVLSTERSPERKRRDVSLAQDGPWPADVASMSPWERLAAHLVRVGANPWLKDSEGLDALDWAFRSGSRSVIRMLFQHPDCPPTQELQVRVDDYPGRRVPWLHATAYRGHGEMFQDLLAHGWSKQVLDQQGWTALSWVNTPEVLKMLLPEYSDLSDEQKLQLRHSWVRRGTMKLYPTGSSLSPLVSGFEQAFPLGEASLQASEEQKVLAQLLAVKPGSTNKYKGVNPAAVMGENPEGFARFFEQHWHVTGVGVGAAKGSWSMPMAGLWAALRYSSERLPQIGTALVEKLRTVSASEWLNTPLRAADKQGNGQAVQGGLTWFVMASMATNDGYDRTTTERLLALEGMWENPGGRSRGLQEAVAFTAAYCGNSASSDWKNALGFRWSNAILNAFRSGNMPDEEASQWAVLAQTGATVYMERWMLLAERLLQEKVIAPVAEEAPSGRYRLLGALLNPDFHWGRTVSSGTSGYQKCRTVKLRLLRALVAAHEHGGTGLLLERLPFAESEYKNMLAENPGLTTGLPSAEGWPVFARSLHLDKVIPAAPSGPSSKPRF